MQMHKASTFCMHVHKVSTCFMHMHKASTFFMAADMTMGRTPCVRSTCCSWVCCRCCHTWLSSSWSKGCSGRLCLCCTRCVRRGWAPGSGVAGCCQGAHDTYGIVTHTASCLVRDSCKISKMSCRSSCQSGGSSRQSWLCSTCCRYLLRTRVSGLGLCSTRQVGTCCEESGAIEWRQLLFMCAVYSTQ